MIEKAFGFCCVTRFNHDTLVDWPKKNATNPGENRGNLKHAAESKLDRLLLRSGLADLENLNKRKNQHDAHSAKIRNNSLSFGQ